MVVFLKSKKNINNLAKRMKEGDSKAFGEIYDYFMPLIFRFFIRRTLSRELSEDLSQEVFLKIINKIKNFNSEDGFFSAWVWQIARNKLIDYWRKEKGLKNFSIHDLTEKTSYTDWEKRIGILDIFCEINKLKSEEKKVFSLFYLSGLSYKEISKITGKKMGTLRVIVCRLTNRIRKKINE